MKKLKVNAFTLVELLIVIVIIAILATLVTVSVVGASKKSRDDKRIGDANTIAIALDQYSTENQRRYPVPSNGTCATTAGTDTYCFVVIPNRSLTTLLAGILNPIPTDPLTQTGYQYVYVYKTKGTGAGSRAAVVIDKLERNTSCNISSSNQSSLPEPVSKYYSMVSAAQTPCYYVAR